MIEAGREEGMGYDGILFQERLVWLKNPSIYLIRSHIITPSLRSRLTLTPRLYHIYTHIIQPHTSYTSHTPSKRREIEKIEKIEKIDGRGSCHFFSEKCYFRVS